jgi:hypothetical protein
VTVHSAREVAAAWERNGGPVASAVEWVAIAMGESSLDDSVVSSAGAIGTWQIMPFNAHYGGGSVGDLYNLDYNAKVAVLMSGGGTNCAAWDSCYVNINRSGRYNYLGYPERGSADWNNIPVAAALIGVDAVIGALPEPSIGLAGDIGRISADVQQLIARGLPALRGAVLTNHQTISRMYQPGWRAWMSSGR